MAANPNPSYASFLGIAKETVIGTAVAPTNFLPVKTMTPMDKLTLLADEGLRGAPAKTYNHLPGPLWAEYEFGGDAFADGIGWPIVGVLGDVTVTGAGAPYTTTAAVLCSGNLQPPTYTLTDWNSAITGYQLAGCRFSEVGLKFAGNGKLEFTAKATALTNATTSKPTFSNPTTSLFAGWQGVCQVGGSTVTYVVDGEVTIKRTVEVIDTADGSQAPYALFAGDVDVTGKATVVMENDTLRTTYTAGTQTTLDFNFLQGAGAATQQIKLHMSNVYLTDAKVTRGKAFAELEIPFVADFNATDIGASGGYSPIKATLQNSMASGTYK